VTVKVAIVGCGTIADRYAPGIERASELELVGATDLERERARRLADAHGARVYPDLETLLTESDAEIVCNLTTHAAHAPVTRRCLEGGGHVYSEKPLAMNESEAWELVSLAETQEVALACAPISLMGDAQQRAWQYLDEGRLGTVRTAYADCNIGRLTEWNANPEGFLRAGPLYDGAVYPLSVLIGYFGPVVRIESAHTDLLLAEHTYDDRSFSVETPDHVVCMLRFADGVTVRLTASMYVPYQTRSFYDLEVHGDDGSIHLDDAAAFDAGDVEFARLGREYRSVPGQHLPRDLAYASGISELATAIETGRRPYPDGTRAAHLVSVIEAIAECGATGEAIDIDPRELDRPEPLAVGPASSARGTDTGTDRSERDLPPIGFGCSRYRGGETYVDLRESIEGAIDAGYRLLDCAELYGNESRIGEILDRPGSPDRDRLYLLSKVWNTNHAPENLRAACERSLAALGIDRFDCYMLHWPNAWAHQGPLDDLAELSHEAATELTFPTDGEGDPLEAEVSLETTWRAMERLVEDGLTRTVGVSNVSVAELRDFLGIAEIPPRVVQVGIDPYTPRTDLRECCRERGIEVMAHSPLSVDGLLDEPALAGIATEHGVSTAQVVLRWNTQRGLVPIPSTTDDDHLQDNLDVFEFSLTDEEMARIDALAD
jgi:diketogulonate reductase-like aldo/keto reductase/predicted dehydrogenase